MQTLVADTVAEHGRLDYTFNNAAATATRGEMGDLPLAAWHRAIDVNLLGVLHGTIAAYSVMLEQGFGHIASIGLVGYPTSIPYSATKAAVVNLSLSLRMEA